MLSDSKIDVSIIIINYNTSKLINNCISSIIEYTKGISYEIIIVDNNTENLSQTINKQNFPRLKFLQLPENMGFGKANNEGAKLATVKYLFLLNPDTMLMNNAIVILYEYLECNPQCGACGGNLFDENLKPVHSFRRIFPSIFWELNELTKYRLEKALYGENSQFNHKDQPMKVAYITGADLMIRKSLFAHCEGFSKDFFMYYEETDLCKRITNNGYSIISVPKAKIKHLEGKSYNGEDKNNSFNEFRWRSIFESMIIYYSKNNSKISKWICLKIAYFTLLLKAYLGNNKNKQIFKTYRKIIKYNN